MSDPCPPGFSLQWDEMVGQYLCKPDPGDRHTERSDDYWPELVEDPLCDYLDDPFPEEIDARYSY